MDLDNPDTGGPAPTSGISWHCRTLPRGRGLSRLLWTSLATVALCTPLAACSGIALVDLLPAADAKEEIGETGEPRPAEAALVPEPLADAQPQGIEFDIRPGRLNRNVDRLATREGWTLARWDAPDFRIHAGYRLWGANFDDLLEALLKPYPVKAELVVGNQNIFVSRRERRRVRVGGRPSVDMHQVTALARQGADPQAAPESGIEIRRD